MLNGRRLRRAGAVLALGAALSLGAPSAAAAEVRVTVEFAYGTAVAGGIGVFIYFAGSWEAGLQPGGPSASLLELRGGRIRWGLPLVVPLPAAEGGPHGADGIALQLVRWRF